MKTILKPIFVIGFIFAFLISSALAVSAETYYIYDYFRYRDADWNSGTVYLSGVTDDIENLTVPDKIATKTIVGIDDYAFYNNTALTGIDLSQAQHLTYIGEKAFRGCSSLESLSIPSTVKYLSEYMVTDCTSLKSLEINLSPKIIPAEMCNNCTSLEAVNIPESVTKIRRYAFGNCKSLAYLEIPKAVEEIAVSAFYNCTNLTLGVWYGSYGYEYAKAQNIPYVLLDNALLGDANGDGVVNINDVTTIQRFKADMETLEEINLHAADVNGDGNVTIEDATVLQQYFAEFDDVPDSIGEVMTQ